MTTYKIAGDTIRIIPTNSGYYVQVQNDIGHWQPYYELCDGAEYETESGACFAILNEYRIGE